MLDPSTNPSASLQPSTQTLAQIPLQPNIILSIKPSPKQMSSESQPVATFIQKTFQILQSQHYQHIIHWLPSGREFAIKSIEQFQDHILPKYFRHRNINSFIRQLNMYGFHKSRKDPTRNIFAHPSFLRGDPAILHLVRRKIKADERPDEENRAPLAILCQGSEKTLNEANGCESKKSLQSLSTLKDSTKGQNEQPTSKSQLQIPAIFSMLSLQSLVLKSPSETTPLKNMIQKSCIMDGHGELYLKLGDYNLFHDESDSISEDGLSIDDDIQRERRVFQNRRSGVTLLQTYNFLDEPDFL